MTRLWHAIGILGCGLVLLAAGCAEDGTLGLNGDSGGGIGGTGMVARGTITDFGSVIVNGIEFFTDDATDITKDGLPAAEGDLRIGMVVLVTGTYEPAGELTASGHVPGRAEQIEYSREAEGPVVVDPVDGSYTVLDRPVILSPQVWIENGDTSPLGPGEHVAVSGLVEADGTIVTTYLERKGSFEPDVDSVYIHGVVSEFSVSSGTFQVDGRTVRFDGGTEFPKGVPNDGDRVKVSGQLQQDGITILTAEVKVLQRLSTGPSVKIEGIVGIVDPQNDQFTLEELVVDSSAAHFKGGTSGDLRTGLQVEVKGTLADTETGQVLRADTVEIEGNDD